MQFFISWNRSSLLVGSKRRKIYDSPKTPKMLRGHPIKSYLRYSVTAAILYSIVGYIFIHNETFRSAWILFIGNVLFACCIAAFILSYNKRRKQDASAGTMVFAGHITTVMGIIIACIICILIFFLLPGAGGSGHTGANEVLNNAAPQLQSGARDQYLLTLIMDAIVGNVSAGSFISIILPYTAKRNQKNNASVKAASEPEMFTQNKV